MSGSIFGKNFSVATWGESHGKGIGVVVDGCPAGIPLDEAVIQQYLDRRKPGASPFATQRKETDAVEIVSGLFEGKTTGTPIAMLIRNHDAHSADYQSLAKAFRPGHADLTYAQKYGIRDYRGGGRASGRETAARVAGGAAAIQFLSALGIRIRAYTLSIGSVTADASRMDFSWQNALCMPDAEAFVKAEALIRETQARQDSLGGVIECVITGLPPGIGEPVFDKLEAVLGYAVLSIGAVKGIEFGAGFAAAQMTGSENNDVLYAEQNALKKRSNHAGGMYGGISDGSPVIFRAAIKPTPSIGRAQDTVDEKLRATTIQIQGRHDPLIVPRAVVVVEAMAGLALADLLLQSLPSTLERIAKIVTGHPTPKANDAD